MIMHIRPLLQSHIDLFFHMMFSPCQGHIMILQSTVMTTWDAQALILSNVWFRLHTSFYGCQSRDNRGHVDWSDKYQDCHWQIVTNSDEVQIVKQFIQTQAFGILNFVDSTV